jgi:hypothetical protein
LSQEAVITGFPVGVGGSVDGDFFKPYLPELKSIADVLLRHPLARAVITGGADGWQYRLNNDAKNPALALGRAHMLRSLLIHEFNVDSAQIIMRSEDAKAKGPEYRYASVRVVWELDDLDKRLDTIEQRQPVEKHFTEVKEITNNLTDSIGLQLSAGLSSSPFGAIPVFNGAITWKQNVSFEAVIGHTFWNGTYRFDGSDLDTKRRMIGGQIIVYPLKDLPVGIVGGWIRIEEISKKHHEYVRMSEGPMLGLRTSPFDFLSVTGVYNPSKHRLAGTNIARAKNSQFLLSVSFYTRFGGGK